MKNSQPKITGFIHSLIAILIVEPAIAAADDLAPIEAFSNVSEIRNVAISPSGNRVAYQQIENEGKVVLVYDVSSGEPVFRWLVSQANISSMRFINDERLLVVYDWEEPYSNFGIQSSPIVRFLDLKNGKFKYPILRSGTPERSRGRLLSWTGTLVAIGPSLETIYIPMFEARAADNYSLFKYSVRFGANSSPMARGSSNTIKWFVDKGGNPLVREDFDPDRGRHTIYVYRNGEATILMDEAVVSRDIKLVALTPEQDSLIYVTHLVGSDEVTYYTMSLRDGSRSEPVLSVHAGGTLLTSGKTAFGFVEANFPEFEYQFLDKRAESLFRSIESSLAGAHIQLVATTDDLEHMVVRVGPDWGAANYLLFSTARQSPIVVAREKTRAFDAPSAPRNMYEFEASDGRLIRALLTAREDTKSAGNAPLIILADSSSQWLAQYFASRGFVVVQPGTRGAYYTTNFMPENDLNWDGKLVSDIEDTVSHFVDQGIADPTRVCIVGIGIGGYAALAAVAQSPKAYRCVASLNGISELRQLFRRVREGERRDSPKVLYFEKFFGVDAKDNDLLDEKSPVKQIDSYFAPALLMYFERSNHIFEDQAKDMRRAMERQDKDVNLVEIPGYDLRFEESDTRLQVLTTVSEFIQEHL